MPRAKRPLITPTGRPQKEIDWEIADEMLRAECHGTSIAARFNMHPQTFYDRVVLEKGVSFTEYSKLKKTEGDDDLRQTQFDVAKKDKNTTMLIWLGKQRLSQKEHQEVVSTPNDEKLDALLADVKSMKEVFDQKRKDSQEIQEQKLDSIISDIKNS